MANLLMFTHGVTLDTAPSSNTARYTAFWQALQNHRPELTDAIADPPLFIEWGHAPLPADPDAALRPDQQLTAAENTILGVTGEAQLRARHDAGRAPDNTFLPPFPADYLGRQLVRPFPRPLKEQLVTLGISDAFYYTSPDGERAVRSAVYGQALRHLRNYRNDPEVALHLVGHSQGATIGFDFLFGLFAPDSEYPTGVPGFVTDKQSHDDDAEEMYTDYRYWRKRAQRGTLVLGSKTGFGSQLAIMMLRKQKLISRLAAGELLDARVIGVRPGDARPQWNIFYDNDDPLGYLARNLFDCPGVIKEYEVDSDWNPAQSHTNYCNLPLVHQRTADLIAANRI